MRLALPGSWRITLTKELTDHINCDRQRRTGVLGWRVCRGCAGVVGVGYAGGEVESPGRVSVCLGGGQRPILVLGLTGQVGVIICGEAERGRLLARSVKLAAVTCGYRLGSRPAAAERNRLTSISSAVISALTPPTRPDPKPCSSGLTSVPAVGGDLVFGGGQGQG